MIELTDQQVQSLAIESGCPPEIVNPHTQETFVLLTVDEYKRLKESEYDDSPWTRDEVEALAWETAERAGWEEIDEIDDAQAKP